MTFGDFFNRCLRKCVESNGSRCPNYPQPPVTPKTKHFKNVEYKWFALVNLPKQRWRLVTSSTDVCESAWSRMVVDVRIFPSHLSHPKQNTSKNARSSRDLTRTPSPSLTHIAGTNITNDANKGKGKGKAKAKAHRPGPFWPLASCETWGVWARVKMSCSPKMAKL